MDIKINFNSADKEKITQLIRYLVNLDSEGSISISTENIDNKIKNVELSSTGNLLLIPKKADFSFGKISIKKSNIGAWGMFNSFLPGKAALRVLSNIMNKSKGPVKFDYFLKSCFEAFKEKGLSQYRGFPKIKDSSESRTEWHLIRPFKDMGLICIEGEKNSEIVSITEKGFEFANLPNPILDGEDSTTILSKKEQEWLTDYLKDIDKRGYEEYSTISEFLEFLKSESPSYEDLVNWFTKNKRMIDYTKTWSRKKDKPEEFRDQVKNLSYTFASGKLALLRELGFVSPKRNDYTVIKLVDKNDY